MDGDEMAAILTGMEQDLAGLSDEGKDCEWWVGLLNDYIAALDMSIPTDEGSAGD